MIMMVALALIHQRREVKTRRILLCGFSKILGTITMTRMRKRRQKQGEGEEKGIERQAEGTRKGRHVLILIESR